MKVLYKGGFSLQEIESFSDIILNRTMTCVHSLIQATNTFGIKVDKKTAAIFEELLEIHKMDERVAPLVKRVWADRGIQETYKRKNEFQLDSNAVYYFENIDRFSEPDFVPSLTDVFKVRQKTTGIMEMKFSTSGLSITLVDVGGQRSERRKWLHCFEQVTAVIYFISLEEYNMQLSEDYRVNRLQEALDLFEEITTSNYFVNCHFFVFYNKEDLFREKITHFPLTQLFDDFSGKDNYEDSLKYIQKLFESKFGGDETHYHPYVTCSLDSKCLEKALEQIKKIIKDKIENGSL